MPIRSLAWRMLLALSITISSNMYHVRVRDHFAATLLQRSSLTQKGKGSCMQDYLYGAQAAMPNILLELLPIT